MTQVTSETISLARLRELLKAAELLADNEVDILFPESEYSAYASVLERDLRELLERRESAQYRNAAMTLREEQST